MECPALPTTGALPPTSLADDVNTVQDELHKLVEEQGIDVIIVCHSYGGIVMSQAVEERCMRSHRSAQGCAGGVGHIAYVAAFVVAVGESLGSTLGTPDALSSITQLNSDGTMMMLDPASRFYNDLPEAEQKQ